MSRSNLIRAESFLRSSLSKLQEKQLRGKDIEKNSIVLKAADHPSLQTSKSPPFHGNSVKAFQQYLLSAILKQLSDGTAQFHLLQPPISPFSTALPLFARIASSLPIGIESAAMKKVEHYSVQRVTGDGRCMFRALVKGMARNKGVPLNPRMEVQDADDLRLAVKEVICDSSSERQNYGEALLAITIDEPLRRYCQRIRRPDFWGGE